MNQTVHRGSRPVRSPYQPAQLARRSQETLEHPIREHVRKLCGTYNLSATFSEDLGALSTLKTAGLIAVQCVLSKDGRPIGIGHGSTIISRLNRPSERAAYSVLNGALMSAINSACKTLDVLRLEAADDKAEADKTAMYRDVYAARGKTGPEPASEKQRRYLMQLASVNLDESERENFLASLEDMTKEEASEAIQRFSN